jgi:hypothetical protein
MHPSPANESLYDVLARPALVQEDADPPGTLFTRAIETVDNDCVATIAGYAPA